MNERISGSVYQQLHHFISVSPWDHEPVIEAIGRDISKLFEDRSARVGLILDESGHRKRGKKSVGVARQYLGSIGKVDNGQVAVFAALNQADEVAMVDTRLYLPKVWTSDKARCKKAGIPEHQIIYKTKPQLGLEMVTQLQGRVKYDWVGGDSIYGNSKVLRQGLQQLNQLYVMDVSEDFQVYLEDPKPYIPPSKPGRGRKKSSYVSDSTSRKAKALAQTIADQEWKIIKVRQATKGPLIRKVKVFEVFVWSAKRVTLPDAEELRLIISCNEDDSELKYSVSNDSPFNRKAKAVRSRTGLLSNAKILGGERFPELQRCSWDDGLPSQGMESLASSYDYDNHGFTIYVRAENTARK